MSALPTLYTEEACRAAAKDAKLRYVRDTDPGIMRKPHGKGFIYIAPNHERVTSDDILGRIRALAIPPAYRAVWICPLENGHLQATGRDDRQRKQYRYHPRWEAMRNETKFFQLGEFAEVLPKIRRRIAEDMKQPGLSRERVLASIIYLMDECQMRVGNAQYATENKTYGLTTLRKKHVTIEGHTITFEFTGKSGKLWKRDVNNRQVANIVKRCEEIPGQELFKYIDDAGQRRDVTSDDVNAYLQEITGKPFTAKDFRTWSATAQAIQLFACQPVCESERDIKRAVNSVIKEVASLLGHTPAICRKSYIHPQVLAQFGDGRLQEWYRTTNYEDDHSLVKKFLERL